MREDPLVKGQHEGGESPGDDTRPPVAREQEAVFALIHVQREVGMCGRMASFAQYLVYLADYECKEGQVPVRHAIRGLVWTQDTALV